MREGCDMPDSSSRRAFAERTGECGAVCSPHPRRARPQVTVATRDRARWAAVTSRATHNSIPRAVLPGSRQHARRIASKADVADQREEACRHGAPEEREPQSGVAFVSLQKLNRKQEGRHDETNDKQTPDHTTGRAQSREKGCK